MKPAKPHRAAIYARYSSDEQRPESIEDQILKCRRHCEALGWTIVGTYSDAAITGATVLHPEYQHLLHAERGQFDVVVVEAVDRLSRRLTFQAALRRKQDQVTRVVNAIVDAGHNPALLTRLTQLEAEAGGLRTELAALMSAQPPSPLEITDDNDALIQAAARDVEEVISGGTRRSSARWCAA